VNQTDEVEIIRHTLQLATDRLQGEKESAIQHGNENELEALCLKISFQRVVSSVLTYCLSLRGPPQLVAMLLTFLVFNKEESDIAWGADRPPAKGSTGLSGPTISAAFWHREKPDHKLPDLNRGSG
jgi:hypothetical protein